MLMRVHIGVAPSRQRDGGASPTLLLQESSVLQLFESLLKLLLRIHDDRAVPRYWFTQGTAADEEETDSLFAGFDGDFVAGIEEDQGTVVGFGGEGGVGPAHSFGGDREGRAGVAEFSGAGEDVGEGVMGGFDREGF